MPDMGYTVTSADVRDGDSREERDVLFTLDVHAGGTRYFVRLRTNAYRIGSQWSGTSRRPTLLEASVVSGAADAHDVNTVLDSLFAVLPLDVARRAAAG